ncbi:TerB family tellurite resistance protein [Maribacter chungangensis]|uniref:TerB family tellurite resistance protein n=1 Tax=Maribacter chungangensis TaxID=1069117 RepID=A0ABW3AYR1_9FLAO
MELNLAEKLAIIKMIYSMVHADGIVHSGEINEVGKLMKLIDFDSNQIQYAQNIEESQSVAILQKMTDDKKKGLTKILEDLAKSDGFVHEKEIELLNNVLASMEV